MMSAAIVSPPAQFLKPSAIRGGMDLLMFAHRSHLRHADEALASRGLGRAHHRVLYFLSRKPGQPVSELLSTLGITKQSLGRVTNELLKIGLIEARVGERDRRQRFLYLTEMGESLERELFGQLEQNMLKAYTYAGTDAVSGYWTMMQCLMDPDTHQRFLNFYEKI